MHVKIYFAMVGLLLELKGKEDDGVDLLESDWDVGILS